MKFKAQTTLPKGYVFFEQIDLNKKQLNTIRIIHLMLVIIPVALGIWLAPSFKQTFVDANGDWKLSLVKILIVSIGAIVYIVGHEAVHGVVMWQISHVKPTFGFSFRYAYAGSKAYFGKAAYVLVALAPLIIWGIIFTLLCVMLPNNWFWVPYLLQIFNLSGAAGDLYVSARMAKMPSDVLVQDSGTEMKLFIKK